MHTTRSVRNAICQTFPGPYPEKRVPPSQKKYMYKDLQIIS